MNQCSAKVKVIVIPKVLVSVVLLSLLMAASQSLDSRLPDPAPQGLLQHGAAKDLKVVSLNINGINRKMCHIKALADSNKPHIICIQETKANPRARLSLPGYKLFNLPKQGPKLGLCTFVSNNVIADMVPLPESSCEMLGINVKMAGFDLTVINTYCSPATSNLNDLRHSDKFANCLWIGDFNARHELYGDSTTATRGRALRQVETNLGVQVLSPDLPPELDSEERHPFLILLSLKVKLATAL